MEKLKQANDLLDSTTAHILAAGTAGSNLLFFEYMALWAQIGSAIYITLMVISKCISMYRDWKDD